MKGNEFLSQAHNYNSYICATRCCRLLIFQTMNFDRPKSVSLKYQRFTESGFKEIGIIKFKLVAKTQFLYLIYDECE